MANAIHAVAQYIRSNRQGARGRNHSGIELLNRHMDYGIEQSSDYQTGDAEFHDRRHRPQMLHALE